nr:MAG TPA: hypothetical protein [Caudoviricetes sp.]
MGTKKISVYKPCLNCINIEYSIDGSLSLRYQKNVYTVIMLDNYLTAVLYSLLLSNLQASWHKSSI